MDAKNPFAMKVRVDPEKMQTAGECSATKSLNVADVPESVEKGVAIFA